MARTRIHQTDGEYTRGFPGLNTPSPPSPTRAHRTPTHAASADRSRNDPDPPLALLGGPVLDARPLGTCSTQHAPLALYQRVGRQGLQDGGGRCRAGLKRWRTVQRTPPAAALARDGHRCSKSEARRPRAHHEQCSDGSPTGSATNNCRARSASAGRRRPAS